MCLSTGYGNANSTDGSSDAKQATFYTSAFEVFAATPTVRVACVFKLDEWSTSQCAAFEQYYNVTEPSFLEYLCTLGLLDTSASPKPAFEVVLEAVQAIRT